MGKFVITKKPNGNFFFKLKADNGQTILASEGYSVRINCDNGIASVKANSIHKERYDKLTAQNGQFYFNLKGSNGKVIGTSEMYETEAARDNGIASVRANAPEAPVDDQSRYWVE
ncbi:YegP family protein [Chitinophaga solisilvae]|uniref:YegP family protein n=1 Tax=Chitinophaga solisilvae TaxID=1233460 RepID=A0A433WD12_9BACT|nr:YegP family protein [Chitinophaga solisilvae]NSL86325.1 YegP family protein [Chitinophaga solisilvae]